MKADFHLLHLSIVDSTNSYLKKISDTQSFNVPVLLIADKQTAGRGQRENKWHSEFEKNLLLSLLIEEKIPVEKSFYLSKITALAIYRLLKDEIENLYVKWTNDVYYGDKKIAGILIENSMKGENIIRSIIGVGVNLNETDFPSKLPNPISLKQITGKTYGVEDFGIKFYDEFRNLFSKFQQGFYQILDNDYNRALYKKGKWIKIRKNNLIEMVKILSVDSKGNLMVENQKGQVEHFAYGAIQFL